MQMVRHEAVRNHFNVKRSRRSQELLQNQFNNIRLNEPRTPLCGAERQEITLQTDVQRRMQTRPFR
jgi:hypothetical protein